METNYDSISVPEFLEMYGTKQQCYEALIHQKWQNGFICPKCKGEKYCKAVRAYDRQCTRCRYVQSPTAGTLFHKVKFDIRKVFLAIYFISTNKKGISSTELARKAGIKQKTAWLFRMKVLQAMESTNRHPLEGLVELNKIKMISEEVDKTRKKVTSKKATILAVEKKGGGAARIYAFKLPSNAVKGLQAFVNNKISKEATIKSCQWCKSNMGELNNTYQSSCPDNKEFVVIRRVEDRLKAWLSGIHGKVKHLQFYLNEYCYRHNRHRMKGEIFDDLLSRMVRHEPRTYFEIIA